MTYLDKILIKTFEDSSDAEKQKIIKAGGVAFLNLLEAAEE